MVVSDLPLEFGQAFVIGLDHHKQVALHFVDAEIIETATALEAIAFLAECEKFDLPLESPGQQHRVVP